MPDEWMTYEQVAEQLNVTPEAARQRAIRGGWQPCKGTDGRARIRMPGGETNDVRTPSVREDAKAVRNPDGQTAAARLMVALEAHVEILKADVQMERERLADERERANKAIADYMRLATEYVCRTDELAKLKGRPWWKRLAG